MCQYRIYVFGCGHIRTFCLSRCNGSISIEKPVRGSLIDRTALEARCRSVDGNVAIMLRMNCLTCETDAQEEALKHRLLEMRASVDEARTRVQDWLVEQGRSRYVLEWRRGVIDEDADDDRLASYGFEESKEFRRLRAAAREEEIEVASEQRKIDGDIVRRGRVLFDKKHRGEIDQKYRLVSRRALPLAPRRTRGSLLKFEVLEDDVDSGYEGCAVETASTVSDFEVFRTEDVNGLGVGAFDGLKLDAGIEPGEDGEIGEELPEDPCKLCRGCDYCCGI